MDSIRCSIGIIVHNEAANIARLINALLKQKLVLVEIAEIIVVSSASTDGTDDIVRALASENPRIQLIIEKERKGKSNAINLFISSAESDILIIESGDTLPDSDTVELLVSPFQKESVGMTGGRPVPENSPATFTGYCVNLLWRLHHRMALIAPKLGEMVAFRRIFTAIPAKSAVDEASIEALIREKGLELRYIPEAIIHNKGPETMVDFIRQRRRIATGHLWLKKTQHYAVSSQKGNLLFILATSEFRDNPGQICRLWGAIFLEVFCRFLGWFDLVIRKKNPFKWEIATTTKNLSGDFADNRKES